MDCRLFGAKPLSEPTLVYWLLDPWEHISIKFEEKTTLYMQSNAFKMSSVKWRPSHPGLNVLSHRHLLEWGSLNKFSPFCYFSDFSRLSQRWLPIEYHVHIWQVSSQLCFDGTVKYESDLKNLTCIYCKVIFFSTEKLANRFVEATWKKSTGNLILVWISEHMPSKVWDEITYPFPNFLGMDKEFTPHFKMDVIIYPWWD